MQQRSRNEPGHERGVLDRIPEPPAAPAKFVVGPPGTKRDSHGQEHPGSKRPWTHPACPGSVNLALDQCGNGKGEGDRKTDIARIEHRRMNGERRILQDRVQAPALDRSRVKPVERVGGQQDKQQEGHRDRALHGNHAGLEAGRQVATEYGHSRTEDRQDQHPQHHRAFMVPPYARDLVDQRLVGMGVHVNVLDRKVGRDVGPGQAAECQRNQAHLQHGGRRCYGHQPLIAAPGAIKRHDELVKRRCESKNERELADLRYHCTVPPWGIGWPSFQTPLAFNASATSRGM